MSARVFAFPLACAAFLLLPVVATADDPGSPSAAPTQGSAPQPAAVDGLAPLCEPVDLGARKGAERCFCSISIDCEDGSTRACNDSTSPCSCGGEDQNCAAGVQGYAQCNGGARQYCPECGGGGDDCQYFLCPGGSYCNNDDDCCALFEPGGTCVNNQCVCF